MQLALTWLHVAAMFVAFTLLPGLGTLLRILAARVDALTARRAIPALLPLFGIGGAFATIGICAGLALAAGFGYGHLWLVGAYVLTAFTAFLGIAVDAPWGRRLALADDATFERVRTEAIPMAAGYLGVAGWLAILWLMLAKPG